MKLQGNAYYGKNGIPLFCCFCHNEHEIRLSLEYKELRSVEFFRLYLEISYYMFIFLTVWDNAAKTYAENFRFTYFEKL